VRTDRGPNPRKPEPNGSNVTRFFSRRNVSIDLFDFCFAMVCAFRRRPRTRYRFETDVALYVASRHIREIAPLLRGVLEFRRHGAAPDSGFEDRKYRSRDGKIETRLALRALTRRKP
jgi:hypothetical protein